MEEFAIVEQLTASDVLLPSQYFGTLAGGKAARYTGERRLMLALLEDAIKLYLYKRGPAFSNSTTRRDWLREEAAHWIFEDKGACYLSFEMVCGALEIEPSYLRNILAAAKATDREAKMQRRQVIGAMKHHVTPLRVRAIA